MTDKILPEKQQLNLLILTKLKRLPSFRYKFNIIIAIALLNNELGNSFVVYEMTIISAILYNIHRNRCRVWSPWLSY